MGVVLASFSIIDPLVGGDSPVLRRVIEVPSTLQTTTVRTDVYHLSDLTFIDELIRGIVLPGLKVLVDFTQGIKVKGSDCSQLTRKVRGRGRAVFVSGRTFPVGLSDTVMAKGTSVAVDMRVAGREDDLSVLCILTLQISTKKEEERLLKCGNGTQCCKVEKQLP